MTESLWGDISVDVSLTTPAAILKEQANELTKATKGILEGRVISGNTGSELDVQLQIAAKAINYSAGIVRILHPISLYPARIGDLVGGGPFKSCDDEAALRAALGLILRSAPVHKMIAALIAQSKT